MSSPNQPQILDALKKIMDPTRQKDLVSLGMIDDLKIALDGKVALRVVLPSPAYAHKTELHHAVEKAVKAIPGVTAVFVTLDARVKGANREGSHQGGTRQPGVSTIPGVANIIAVSSGKGGVGKSTVAVNLAVALSLEGARVGLMDTDVYGPNIPTMMGVTEQPKIIQVGDKEVFVPPTAHGIKVMSMGMLIQPDQPLVWRGPMLHSVISQFCHQVEWGELDYLVVDMPPGTGDVQLSLAQMVPVTGAILVSTPQEVSMQDVRKAYAMFDKVRIPIIGIVENMSYFEPEDAPGKKYFIFGEGGGKILAQKFKTELLAQFPIVTKIREGGDQGRPITVSAPDSETSRGFKRLAHLVAERVTRMADEGVDPTQLIQIGKF